jgi:hypothetical protein
MFIDGAHQLKCMSNTARDGFSAKIVVCILGMGRTGSSLLSQTLSVAGCQLPGPALAASPDNPDGFWEPLEVLAIKEDYLLAHNSRWHDISLRPLETPESNAFAKLQDDVAEFFQRHADIDLMVIKELRTVMTTSTWFKGAINAGYDIRIAIPVRHPGAVIASLLKRDHISEDHAAALWIKYSLFSEYNSRKYNRIFVDYDNMIFRHNCELDRLKNVLGLPIHCNDDLERPRVLKPELRHHIGQLDKTPANLPDCMQIYAELKKAASGLSFDHSLLDEARVRYCEWLESACPPG